MVIKLLPNQIPKFWEAIKFATVSADEVNQENQGSYLNELLHSLLNSKSQCFVRLDEERKLLALAITKIVTDKITDEKGLLVQILYSWKLVNPNEWEDAFSFVKDFAKHTECKYIYFESRNSRVWQLGETIGFKEVMRGFRLDLGGI